MTNDAARRFVQEDDGLGSLKNRPAQMQSLVKTPAEKAQDLIDRIEAAKLNRNREAFYAAQAELKGLVEQL